MSGRLILIPPSEGKKVGGVTRVSGANGSAAAQRLHPLSSDRDLVAKALAATQDESSTAGLAKLLGARGETLERAVQANYSIGSAPLLRAVERYNGVLYQHLDFESLGTRAHTRANKSLLIVSGLYGLVAPGELIAEYRLKMSASLDGLGRMSTWWRPMLTSHLEDLSKNRELWNLLPQEHRAALDMPPRKIVTSAVFLEPNAEGDLVAVNHWNKALKGSLVRLLLDEPSIKFADLADWKHPLGYRLDPSSIAPANRQRVLKFVASKR